MKTMICPINNINRESLFKRIFIPSIIFILPFTASATINAHDHDGDKHDSIHVSIEKISVDSLIEDVLKNTEVSLTTVESDTWNSLQHVENAMASILLIKAKASPDTHHEAKSPKKENDSKEYWFVYPKVSEKILADKDTYPTLYDKKKMGVLYTGKEKMSKSAYFDYPFAYASLKTAREALAAKEYERATIALKWVFEAIYVTPDFNVVSAEGEKS